MTYRSPPSTAVACAVIGCDQRAPQLAHGWGVLVHAGQRHTLCQKHNLGAARGIITRGKDAFLCGCGAVVTTEEPHVHLEPDSPSRATLAAALVLGVVADGHLVEVEVSAIDEGVEESVRLLGEKIRAADPSPDELAALHQLVDRVFGVGRRSYGPMREALDARDFAQEALHELLDSQFYGAVDLIRLMRLRRAT